MNSTKKYIVTLFLCSMLLGLIIISVVDGMSRAQPKVCTVDLILHYKMWDGLHPNSRVFDYSFKNPFPNDGVIAGGVTATFPGYLFDEGVINASRGATDNMWDGGGTLSVWLRPKGQGENDKGRVFDKSTNSSIGWLLQCPASDALLEFVVIGDVCDGCWQFPVDIIGDKWQHVVIVYNSDNRLNNPVVYVDGVSVTVTRIRFWTPGWDRADDSGAYLYLGSRAAGARYWDGSMDDAMLFSSSLEGDEARSIYESTRWRYSK